MNTIRISKASLEDNQFKQATTLEIGIWFRLYCYCLENTDNGIIDECHTWEDRQWLFIVGVTEEEVMMDSGLFGWEDGNVHVCYPEVN